MVRRLRRAWGNLHAGGANKQKLAHYLLTEVNSFPAAVELASLEAKTSDRYSPVRNRLVGVAKTIIDSVRDILRLQPVTANVLKVGSELMGIFQGDRAGS